MKKLSFLLIPVIIITWISCKKKDDTPADAQCGDFSGLYYKYISATDTLFAPTVFTPNGDGKNDFFHLISPNNAANLTGFSMTIYAGATAVFSTTSSTGAWDGKINGARAGMGRYVVRLKFTDGSGNKVDDCTCVDILQYNSATNCYISPSITYFYEDQFDPSKGPVAGTSEQFCP